MAILLFIVCQLCQDLIKRVLNLLIMGFSEEEKLDIVSIFIKCNKNKRLSVAEYRRTFPDRMLPSRDTFRNVYNLLRNSKSIKRKPREITANEDLIFYILLYFQGKFH